MKIVASIPAFNSASTIKETIISLVTQSVPFYKIRVYDNKSTDNTCDIVKEMMIEFPVIELVENEMNLGAEGSFTKCISEASEDLCLIAHADDIYHKDFVKHVIDVFAHNQSVVATFCRSYEINGKGEIIGSRFSPGEITKNEVSYLVKEQAITLFYKYGNFVTCPSVVMRSDVLRNKIKIWDGKTYNTSADLDVWMRLLDFGSLAFINKYLINYRVAEASYSFRIAKIRTSKHEIFKVLEGEKYKVHAKNHEKNLRFLLNKDYANRFLNVLRTKDCNQIRQFNWAEPCSLLSVVAQGFSSRWHLKIMIAIVSLRILYAITRLI